MTDKKLCGGTFSLVEVYKDYIIKKYKNVKVRGVDRNISYNTEKKALLLLKDEKYFPKILDFDDKNFEIKMSYCGYSLDNEKLCTTIFNFNDYEENFKSILNSLNKHKIQHHDVDRWNLCFLDNSFYLIDFNIIKFDELTNESYYFNALKNRVLVKKWNRKKREYYD